MNRSLKYKQSISLAQIDTDLKQLTETHHTLTKEEIKVNLVQLESRMKSYEVENPTLV